MRGLTAEGRPGGTEEIGALVASISRDQRGDRRTRAGQLGRLAVALATSARAAGARAVATGRWLADVVVDAAPHVPVRDLPTLRAQHGGLSGDALASALVAAASRATATVGAAGGAFASVQLATPPTVLLSAPVLVAAETMAVVAIELKLVAELHEVYARGAVGTRPQRAAAYLGAWSRRRGIDPFGARPGLGVLGLSARYELRQRLLRRAGRNVSTLAPFLAGAVAGAELNRRETRRVAERIVADLGGRLP